jgi:hypothetical protein
MATVYAEIEEGLRDWIGEQPLFFVATAPSGAEGHVNVSPKGGSDTFAILGPREVAYIDLFGSGIETVAHLKENGRIVVMFCAFAGPPRIIRLHGHGEVVEQGEHRFPALRSLFELADEVSATVRSVIRIDVERIAESCGFVVPLMRYERGRDHLFKLARTWTRTRGPDAVRDYCDVNNGESLDGLPALRPFRDSVSTRQREAHDHRGRKL